jgi:hypothetical protein
MIGEWRLANNENADWRMTIGENREWLIDE